VLISSSREDGAAEYSPDGQKIAFQSDRSGSREVWVTKSDGSDAVQLAFFGEGLTGTPRWSPDGRQIAFASHGSNPQSPWKVFVVPAEGGVPRLIPTGPYAAECASWSHDGLWIYFYSLRSGVAQVWKAAVVGGEPVQVTRNGGAPFESPDRTIIFYSRLDANGIWKVPVEGGEKLQVVKDLQSPDNASWAVTEHGIYYVNGLGGGYGTIDFFDFATGRVRRLARFENEPDSWDAGLSVSPDERWVLFSQLDHKMIDLVLVKNFR